MAPAGPEARSGPRLPWDDPKKAAWRKLPPSDAVASSWLACELGARWLACLLREKSWAGPELRVQAGALEVPSG